MQAAADCAQAVADRAIVRVADLSSTLTATNRDLTDAVAARDKAAGTAKEWEHKYHITKEAADRERFKRTKDPSRLRHFQRVQNLSCYSATPPSDEEGSPALPWQGAPPRPTFCWVGPATLWGAYLGKGRG